MKASSKASLSAASFCSLPPLPHFLNLPFPRHEAVKCFVTPDDKILFPPRPLKLLNDPARRRRRRRVSSGRALMSATLDSRSDQCHLTAEVAVDLKTLSSKTQDFFLNVNVSR